METTTRSSDGTVLAYRSHGSGPGLVVVPGSTRRAHHYDALASALAETVSVHVVERRGRGASGPQGPAYGLDREVEDVLAVLDATGSTALFGHSYGGLVALETARVRTVATLIVYEPSAGLSARLDTGFTGPLADALARGRYATAMARLISGLGLARMPAPLTGAVCWLMMRGREGAVLRETIRTVPAEIQAGLSLDPDLARYAAITARTLLLGGERSPQWLRSVLTDLDRTMPGAALVMAPRLDHNAPDQDGPDVIAGLVRAFLAPERAVS